MVFFIGDHAVKSVGVTAEPEVKIFEIDQHDKFMIMGSDGVWEFISSQEAVDIVQACFDKGYGAPEACQELIETAAAMWQEEEGDYRDDVSRSNFSIPHTILSFFLHRSQQLLYDFLCQTSQG